MVENDCTDQLIITNQYPDEADEIIDISTSYSPSLYLEQEIKILEDNVGVIDCNQLVTHVVPPSVDDSTIRVPVHVPDTVAEQDL